ncbi:Amino acid/polyamine transporter I [Penicillium expansum]|uniref:Amino acid/polyamine transporter I n=1 Tax=Penicillium expansum TaxID=27334 RepID=A0A0A2IJ23_PENEN|nr:Amino acid/polyamine transporter I [Penicillium expansum]KAJ5518889.1 Amino acid/polyamine transporter I [Penicillium expansum]KGO42438.1 Amino acid/polyamine transporter I [Penicillium expansum]KGO62916.1 Amino acid/polyamine transporter I [Penicillium expansum]
MAWRRSSNKTPAALSTAVESQTGEVTTVSGKYISETGGNNAATTYQDASGAPVEHDSPLGYSVGPVTITLLNITMMIGAGIYSTPSSILSGTGSVGVSLIYWTLGYLICLTSGAVYLEFTAYFPSRSGSEVVFLEQAYPNPKWLFPTTFAAQSVILSFGSANATVMAKYLIAISGHTGTNWQIKGTALACYSLATLTLVFNTKYAYWFSNAVGVVKICTLLFVIVTGFVVLGGNTRVENPKANFHDVWSGSSTASAYGFTTALYRIIFSYGGYNNAFNVANEVKNPVRSLKIYATLALTVVYVLYMFANIAFFAAVPKEEIESSDLTTASLFFEKVFGASGAVRGLNFLIALASFGNMIAVIIGLSRRIRECGRQGVLPFTEFWVSTKPFGTTLGPYAVVWSLTALMILAVPAGDAFTFVNDLSIIPGAAFNLAMGLGIYIVRWRRRQANLPEPEFKAWHVVILFNVLVQLYLLVMPWYPPAGGQYAGDVSFWYGTSAVTGIGILLACGIYYYIWAFLIPNWKGYRLRQEPLKLDGGVQSNRLRKVPVAELAEWDSTHDAAGRPIESPVEIHVQVKGIDV